MVATKRRSIDANALNRACAFDEGAETPWSSPNGKTAACGLPSAGFSSWGTGSKASSSTGFRSSMAAMSALAFSVRRARAAVRTSRNILLASMVAGLLGRPVGRCPELTEIEPRPRHRRARCRPRRMKPPPT